MRRLSHYDEIRRMLKTNAVMSIQWSVGFA